MPCRIPNPCQGVCHHALYQGYGTVDEREYAGISIDEGNLQRGQVVVALPIGQEFVNYVSTITGTQVNLFLGGSLSFGRLADYSQLDKEALSVQAGSDAEGFKGSRGLQRSLSIGKEQFFEGVYPLVEKGAKIGSASILLSKAETQKKCSSNAHVAPYHCRGLSVADRAVYMVFCP